MKPESDFAQIMALLAAEHRAVGAPPGVERAVLGEFDSVRRRRIFRIAAAGAVAAVLVAGVLDLRRPAPAIPRYESRITAVAPTMQPAKIQPPERRRRSPKRAVSPPQSPEAPFIAIPWTVPPAPEERITMVRMTLSPSAMAAVGFPLEAGVPRQADVLIGQDGRARAIRIVSNSDFR